MHFNCVTTYNEQNIEGLFSLDNLIQVAQQDNPELDRLIIDKDRILQELYSDKVASIVELDYLLTRIKDSIVATQLDY